MALTEKDFMRAANDKKFMAARWKQRVAISQKRLDTFLSSSASKEDKEKEILMHKKRLKKAHEVQKVYEESKR